jgi:YHS domain-containing protein
MSKWQVAFCLYFSFITSLSDHSQAADPTTIRKDIARLTSEVSDRLKQIASLESQLDTASPRMGLEGYCPVTLVNDMKWVIGSPDHSVTFEGCAYFFADMQRMQEFQQSPHKYTPTISGHDPVLWFEKGERVVGRRNHGVYHRGKIVLFASEESLRRYSDDPRRYVILVSENPSQTTSSEHKREAKHSYSRTTTTRNGQCHRRRLRRR